MNLFHLIRSLPLVLAVGAAAPAQVFGTYVTQTAGAAPYDVTIGNSWLGGGVHAHLRLSHTRHTLLASVRGTLDAQLRAYANVLNRSKNIFDITANLSNSVHIGMQTRSGQFRVRVLDSDLIMRSFGTSTDFGNSSWSTLSGWAANDPPLASFGVGPITFSVRGNLGAGLSSSANYILSPGTATASAYASFSVYGQARVGFSVGIPYLCEGGLAVDGQVFNQTLTLFGGVNPSGFFGTAVYTLTPIAIRLFAWVDGLCTGFFYHDRTLCRWSSRNVHLNLF
jgi:hypothetical protein